MPGFASRHAPHVTRSPGEVDSNCVQPSSIGSRLASRYVVMACIVMAYIVMAYIVPAFIVMVYVFMAYVMMAYVVMAYVVMAYIVMVYIVNMSQPLVWCDA